MTTTHIADTEADLDAYTDDALRLINKQRSRTRAMVLSLLGAALLALLGATFAMYGRSPVKAESFRTGTSR